LKPPEAVFLKRLAAPRTVLILGIVKKLRIVFGLNE